MSSGDSGVEERTLQFSGLQTTIRRSPEIGDSTALSSPHRHFGSAASRLAHLLQVPRPGLDPVLGSGLQAPGVICKATLL